MSEETSLRETHSHEDIIFFSPKGKLAILTGGATVFLIMWGRDCFETLLSFKGSWDIIFLLAKLLMTIVCALLVMLFSRLRFMPLLIITDEGIEDHSYCGTPFVTIRVRWEEIARISTTNQQRTSNFQVDLTVAGWQAFLDRHNRFSRFLLRKTITRLGDVYPVIVLLQFFLPIPTGMVIAQIREHFLPQLTAYGIALQQNEL
ncbi:MAG: hypothetical protein H0U76_10985 [Ktedonobacteraceae bacterium]|nr:hypothetical protein [Ktedonobacteraceae bacterium]